MSNSFLKKIALVSATISIGLLFAAPACAANKDEVGIATSASLVWMDPSQLNSRLDDIGQLGATWVRVDFNWPSIQPDGPNQYNWSDYDRVVAATAAHHLKILATLGYTPAWASDPACAARVPFDATKCNPRNPADFANFAGSIANRYKGKNIRGWEIWNEPNLLAYWKTVGDNGHIVVSPWQYAQNANAAAAQIRKYNSDADIITGGLAPMFEPGPTHGMRQSDYLKVLLPFLNKNLFDGVAMHPYSWPVFPEQPSSYNAFYTVDHGGTALDLLAIMHAQGWDNKQLWATEYGASTVGISKVTKPTKYARPDHVTENAQAQMISQGILDWYDKPSTGPIFVHSDGDQWLQNVRNEKGFGLRREDGSKKPSYFAFQQAVSTISLEYRLSGLSQR